MTSEGISVLAPPYRFPTPLGAAPPALGAFLIAEVPGLPGTADHLWRVQCSAPWCPVCLALSSRPATADLLRSVQRLPKHLAYPYSPHPGDPPDVDALVHAVESRPAPTPEDLAGYVAGRTKSRKFGNALLACFHSCDEEMPPGPAIRSWLSRQFTPLGPLTARDWAAVYSCLPLAHSRSSGSDRVAYDLGMDPRTARARIQRYTGMSLADVRQRVGWEWMMEAVLRHWRYVDLVGATPSRRASWVR